MELLYGLFLLLFLIGGGAAIYLTIRNLQTANVELTLRAATAEQRLREYVQTLSAEQRKTLEQARTRSRPMKNPPVGLLPTLQRLRQIVAHAGDPYAFAIGWEVTRNQPDIVSLSLANDSYYRSGNIAITGEPGHGKGTLGMSMLLQLAHQTTTSQLRIQIIDPKVSDGELWRGKAHMWRSPVLGDDGGAIRAIFDALREERRSRDRLRAEHRVRDWEQLPPSHRPPLLVVWITELATVTKIITNCDDWLETELAQCRASGIRYLIDLQNQSGKETAWRSQIGTYIAGFQSSAHHIRPNIGLSAEEITTLGGVLLTELEVGQFTVRNKRDVITVAVPRFGHTDLLSALDALPNAPEPAPLGASNLNSAKGNTPAADEAQRTASTDDLGISEELWQQIANTAREIERTSLRPTRAEVWRKVFAHGDSKATPSGDNYKRVRVVCDAEGLLLARPRAEMVDTA